MKQLSLGPRWLVTALIAACGLLFLWVTTRPTQVQSMPEEIARPSPAPVLNVAGIYGQSLAAGYGAAPTATAAYSTVLMFTNSTTPPAGSAFGLRNVLDNCDPSQALAGAVLTGFQTFTEQALAMTANCPGFDGQTIASGLWFSINYTQSYQVLTFDAAVSVMDIATLSRAGKPGSRAACAVLAARPTTGIPYCNLMTHISRAVAINSPHPTVYRSTHWLQGETEVQLGTSQAAYLEALGLLQADIARDAMAITGQTFTPVLIIDQIASWTAPGYGVATSAIPIAQYLAPVAYPGLIYLAGPKYQLEHNPDGIHLTSASEEHDGEMHAEVYQSAVINGANWIGMRPLSITSDGRRKIRAVYNDPSNGTGCSFDTSLVTDPATGAGCTAPGNLCRGFEYGDDDGRTIDRTPTLTGPGNCTVSIHLSGNIGPNPVLRYAYTGVVGNNAGPATGPRGNLRDNAAAISRTGDGFNLYHWADVSSGSVLI
jgi:hypothetical protein